MSFVIVISPAKKLNTDALNTYTTAQIFNYIQSNLSQPEFIKYSKKLIDILRTYSIQALMDLMHISFDLAKLNTQRYTEWQTNMHGIDKDAKPALFLFNGDVYDGLCAHTLDIKEIKYIQKYLRILSGLYGILKPLDCIYPHRLEMGTKLMHTKNVAAGLYTFWQNLPTQAILNILDNNNINNDLKFTQPKIIINLASSEYFKVIQAKLLKENAVQCIDIIFEQKSKNNIYKNISFLTKKARGLMLRYMAQRNITQIEQLKEFNIDNYMYQADLSTHKKLVFRQFT